MCIRLLSILKREKIKKAQLRAFCDFGGIMLIF